MQSTQSTTGNSNFQRKPQNHKVSGQNSSMPIQQAGKSKKYKNSMTNLNGQSFDFNLKEFQNEIKENLKIVRKYLKKIDYKISCAKNNTNQVNFSVYTNSAYGLDINSERNCGRTVGSQSPNQSMYSEKNKRKSRGKNLYADKEKLQSKAQNTFESKNKEKLNTKFSCIRVFDKYVKLPKIFKVPYTNF